MSFLTKALSGLKKIRPTESTEQVLVNFAQPKALESLVTKCDEELGGYSTVNLAQERPTTGAPYGRFFGNLSLDLPKDNKMVTRSGFAMFRTLDQPSSMFKNNAWNWEQYRHLELRVRGDRRKYFVNVQSATPLASDLYQHRLFIQTPGEWETVVIPIDDFILTNKGVVQEQMAMDTANVYTVGIGLIDRQYGPYSLDIEYIKAVAHPPLEFKPKEEYEGEVEKETVLLSPGQPMELGKGKVKELE
ncbi:Complex I intermediate-associated protein 30 [Yarrowia sp. B02]|nr:Complex I intermediate-associated protein 30 [Yarrowia sp. B02]